jgi:hypothetical protein
MMKFLHRADLLWLFSTSRLPASQFLSLTSSKVSLWRSVRRSKWLAIAIAFLLIF